MKVTYSLLLILLLSACSSPSSSENFVFFEVNPELYSKIINQKPMPSEPSGKDSVYIENTSYPIQIALYADHKFYYNLPTLGDGVGTWKQEKKYISLHAKRRLFDMYIEVKALDEKAENFGITFTDRFGPQAIRVQQINSKN